MELLSKNILWEEKIVEESYFKTGEEDPNGFFTLLNEKVYPLFWNELEESDCARSRNDWFSSTGIYGQLIRKKMNMAKIVKSTLFLHAGIDTEDAEDKTSFSEKLKNANMDLWRFVERESHCVKDDLDW